MKRVIIPDNTIDFIDANKLGTSENSNKELVAVVGDGYFILRSCGKGTAFDTHRYMWELLPTTNWMGLSNLPCYIEVDKSKLYKKRKEAVDHMLDKNNKVYAFDSHREFFRFLADHYLKLLEK